MTTKLDAHVSLRLPRKLLERFQKMADEEGRSLNAQMLSALEHFIETLDEMDRERAEAEKILKAAQRLRAAEERIAQLESHVTELQRKKA
ncbi:MAG TPA: Arc family DNA-binding protein [Planctomycetota bacterium]|nr:Arc family DNA-binding protein [Planctomycetota bacterium]